VEYSHHFGVRVTVPLTNPGRYFSRMQLSEILARSSASEEFKAHVRAYDLTGQAPAIETARRSPRIKVLRLIAQLLHAHPELRVERISVDAWSGCSDFQGHVVVETDDGSRLFDFRWDCHWRALEQGWYDAFSFPDQIRAANEFDWRCFSLWKERALEDADLAGVS
jgi:hypothetical protein